jgi:hypothetical protein
MRLAVLVSCHGLLQLLAPVVSRSRAQVVALELQ